MSSARPLPIRLRPDLVAQQQTYQGRPHWLIKDPVALKYYRFEPEEYALLQMLDGRTSIAALEQRFAGKLATDDIPRFLAQMLQLSLVTADGVAASASGERPGPPRRARGGLGSLICLRIPLGDPQRLLTWLVGRVGWLFSMPAVLAGILFGCSALLLVLIEFDVFVRRLPSMGAFFGPGNLYLLAIALALVKVVHEFGHGLSCRRFGGECHEMGVLLLLMTPCLYCDVSDGWMLASKWRRAAIGAAGMYCELVLAAAATYLWWWTEPGVLHYLALNIMFVSSVSTVLVNLNPLLRYDGYYILADLVEVPNLRQKSAAAVGRLASRLVCGLRSPPGAHAPDAQGRLLLLYGVASIGYRLFVSLSILVFLYYALEPYGLQSVGQCLAAALLVAQILGPLRRSAQRLRVTGRWQEVSKMRLLTSALVTGSCLLAVAWLPLPQWVSCSFYVQPEEAPAVYADVGGQLVAVHVTEGEYVEAGQPIATLENLDLEVALLDLEARQQQIIERRRQLDERALHDQNAGLEMEELERARLALARQLTERRRECEQLVLRAPRAGVILPLPTRVAQHSEGELRRWSGSLLDARNRGAFVQAGDAICLVGDPERLMAVLTLAQEDLEFVTTGAAVELLPATAARDQRTGQIQHVARRAMHSAPAALSVQAGGTLAMQMTAGGHQRPREATYQASVPLADPQHRLLPGSTGRAKVHVGHCTLGAHLYRWAERTLRIL